MSTETRLTRRLSQINTSLDQWVLEYRPLNHAQCISLLERATILSRIEVVKYIFAVIIGFESELFIWNEGRQMFHVAQGYAMAHLNVGPFRSFLAQYAEVGTKFRQMYAFTEVKYFRGRTFSAFQAVLRSVLDELIGQTVEMLDRKFINNKTQKVNEFTISLLGLAPYLDSDANGKILLTIRTLYSIYLEVLQEQPCNSPRLYCNQTLTAVYRRISIPHKRLRNIVYTVLDHCLRPMFISLEYLITRFQLISELSESSEFLFSSHFKSDEELYFTAYPHTELVKFWNDFFHFDDQLCTEFPLFSSCPNFKVLMEAIKASFVFRKNGRLLLPTLTLESGRFLREFHHHLNERFQRYAKPGDRFNLDSPYEEHEVELKVSPTIKRLLNLPQPKVSRFKGFTLPFCTAVDIHTILSEALCATFETISRPIVQHFLVEFRSRHLKLFRFYADFFLVQHPEHILQYIYFLFPLVKDALSCGTFSVLGQELHSIHRNNATDFAEVLHFFRPNLFRSERLHEYKDHTAQLQLFNSLYFVPSFSDDFKQTTPLNASADRPFYDFWPLTQLFNSTVSDLFNRLLQFLLKLRYSQYQLGVEFFLSPRFRLNHLSKADYLCRYRMLNQVVLMGRQMECRLKELVQVTEARFKGAATFEEYLAHHQRFIEKISQLYAATNSGQFIQNILNSVSKFCYTNAATSPSKNRRLSIYEALGKLDRMNQDEYFGSVQL